LPIVLHHYSHFVCREYSSKIDTLWGFYFIIVYTGLLLSFANITVGGIIDIGPRGTIEDIIKVKSANYFI
jgi:hypothetical protein